MPHIVAISGFSKSVSHIPFRHCLIAREEMDAGILLFQRRQEILNELRTEPIATVTLIKSKEINIHAAT